MRGSSSVHPAVLGELAELAVFEQYGALEVGLCERDTLLGGEERGAQRAVADVAAREREAARERGEVERAGGRDLRCDVRRPQLGAQLLVGEREVQAHRQPALERLVDRALEVRRED